MLPLRHKAWQPKPVTPGQPVMFVCSTHSMKSTKPVGLRQQVRCLSSVVWLDQAVWCSFRQIYGPRAVWLTYYENHFRAFCNQGHISVVGGMICSFDTINKKVIKEYSWSMDLPLFQDLRLNNQLLAVSQNCTTGNKTICYEDSIQFDFTWRVEQTNNL